jgi:hypothetical protein
LPRRATAPLWPGVLLLLLASCESAPTAPAVDAPYLAILAKVDAAPGVDVGQEYQFRVEELSGTLGVDTLIRVAPGDTIILPVQPATYLVTASGVPP